MPLGLTSSYTVKNWLEASKGRIFLAYLEGEGGEQTNTKFLSNTSPDNGSPFSRDDFERDLRKVSRRVKK